MSVTCFPRGSKSSVGLRNPEPPTRMGTPNGAIWSPRRVPVPGPRDVRQSTVPAPYTTRRAISPAFGLPGHTRHRRHAPTHAPMEEPREELHAESRITRKGEKLPNHNPGLPLLPCHLCRLIMRARRTTAKSGRTTGSKRRSASFKRNCSDWAGRKTVCKGGAKAKMARSGLRAGCGRKRRWVCNGPPFPTNCAPGLDHHFV